MTNPIPQAIQAIYIATLGKRRLGGVLQARGQLEFGRCTNEYHITIVDGAGEPCYAVELPVVDWGDHVSGAD